MPKTFVWGIVKDTVVVWVIPPPLAVTVIFDVPMVAVVLAVNVSVELPLPGAAMEAGLRLAVTPVGIPEAESATAELKPPLTAVEMVVLPELPRVPDRLTRDDVPVTWGDAAGARARATVAAASSQPP